MDEISDYEAQLAEVREAIKLEPSNELKEVETELESLIDQLKSINDKPPKTAEQNNANENIQNIKKSPKNIKNNIPAAASQEKPVSNTPATAPLKESNAGKKPVKESNNKRPVVPNKDTTAKPDVYETSKSKWKSFKGRVAKR